MMIPCTKSSNSSVVGPTLGLILVFDNGDPLRLDDEGYFDLCVELERHGWGHPIQIQDIPL